MWLPMTVAAMLCFIFAVIPWFSDDLAYAMPMRGVVIDGESWNYPFSGWIDGLADRYYKDNLRLANVVFSSLLPLGHFLMATLSAIMAFTGMYFTLLVARLPMRSFASGVWVSIFWALGLGWVNDVWQQCFIFNYLWSSTWVLITIYLFINIRRASWAACVVLSVVTGMWHEGLSVPLAAAFILTLPWVRSEAGLSKRMVMSLLLLACGLWQVYGVPGVMNCRMPADDTFQAVMIGLPGIVQYHLGFLAFLVLAAVVLILKDCRRHFDIRLFTVLSVASVLSILLHARVPIAARVGWMANLCSVCGCLWCGYILVKAVHRFTWVRGACMLFTYLACAFVLLHYVAICRNSVRYKDSFNDILQAYRESPTGQVFYNVPARDVLDVVSLGRPRQDLFLSWWHLHAFNAAYGKDGKGIQPVPQVLATVTESSGIPLDYTPGAHIKDGYVFMSMEALGAVEPDYADAFKDGACFVNAYVHCYRGKGIRTRSAEVYMVKFTSRADGRDYVFVNTCRIYLDELLHGPLTGIKFGH